MAQVSIVVTSYNIEQWLDECLDSIRNQTLSDIEIIVVDDGSTDASPDIIARHAAQDPRVVAVLLPHNTPGGVATAANAGMDRATAPWVGFADGDDVYDLDMFEKLHTTAVTHDADLSMCNYQVMHTTTGELSDPADTSRWSALHRDHYVLDVPTRKEFLRFVAVPWRKLYRRSMLVDNQIRYPEGDWFYEDNPFHWFSLLSADSIAVVPEALCRHRVARPGQSMDTVDARLFKIFAHHGTILDWLRAHDLVDVYAASLLGWAMSQMEWIARRTPHELRRELFGILREVFAAHDAQTVQDALREGHKGQFARTLSMALQADSLAAFERALDTNAQATNPLVSAMYHLKHTGVPETARMTTRWVGRRLANKTKQVTKQLTAGRSHQDLPTDELFFALSVMSRRIEHLEHQVRRLADVSAPSDNGTGQPPPPAPAPTEPVAGEAAGSEAAGSEAAPTEPAGSEAAPTEPAADTRSPDGDDA